MPPGTKLDLGVTALHFAFDGVVEEEVESPGRPCAGNVRGHAFVQALDALLPKYDMEGVAKAIVLGTLGFAVIN